MTLIQIRRGNASAWTAANPVLSEGEFGYEADTGKLKVGDGSTAWVSLSYFPVEWSALTGRPTVIASGATQSEARASISAASLDVNGKVPASELPNSIMAYQGTWDADTNTPTLLDGTGSTGDVYRVQVAGDRNLGSGSISFSVGDYVIYNGTAWEKSDTTDAVATVAGRTGNIVLTAADVDGVATLTGSETLTNKTVTNPTITGYTESAVAIGTVGATHTIALTNGTVQTATLTASTATTFTMPTAVAGKSFLLILKQPAATGGGTATFSGVLWAGGEAPVVSADPSATDVFSFVSDGSSWFGSASQAFA